MTRIPVAQICYVRLGTRKIEESARFASDVLGLQRVSTVDGDIAFRSDHLYHRICLTEGAPDQQSIGLELPDETYLEPARAALVAAGFRVRDADADECKRRHVRQALLTQDGSGNEIDLVTRPAHSGRRYFPSRDAGITGFQGVGLRSTDLERDRLFWTELLNAKISDRVGEITYLQIDARHHRVVLYPSKRKGILDVSLDVESFDCVMQSNYFLKERQIKILHGPGRETASDQTFLRFQGPEDCVFSYVHGMRDIGGTSHRPRQYALNRETLCNWGSECVDIPELNSSSI
jgi:2,3-dihydroxy-p-cumate/2,3-dihydroxybenzoate 3,4-dioxygenase